MILNITSYNLCGYLISHSPYKIPITPKLSCPKLSLYLRKLLEYHFSTPTLEYSHYLPRSILRWCTKKYMYMVFYYCHCLYLKLIYFCYLFKYLLHPFGYSLCQNCLSVLWYPYKMIFKVVYRMRGSLYRAHTQILYSFMPKGQPVFIPVVELSGYSTGSLINRESEVSMAMILPQSFIRFPASCMKKYAAFALMANIVSYSSSVVSTNGFLSTLPTVLTAMSTRPYRLTAPSNSLTTSETLVRSPWMANAFPPAAWTAFTVSSAEAFVPSLL